MFDISPDHAIGIYAGLVALAAALLALRLRPGRRGLPGTVLGASVLLAVSGAIHLGLITTHLREPVTVALFLMNGTGYLVLSQAYTWRWWRPASAALLTSTLIGYLIYIAFGFDTPDQVALATKLLELTALGLVLVPVRGERDRPRRIIRWAALGAAVPLLTLVTTATVWIVDLARPDATHAHAGAVLQQSNAVASPDQVAAAATLYAETKAAITPYEDWHVAWAAGFRPGPTNMPSTHWINQHNVNAGYVLDPAHPQGLVYANTKHGPVLLGAMFQMKQIGQFGPDPGGPLTAWHEHVNICVTPFGGFEFSFMTPMAVCPIGAIDLTVPAMLHVWIVPNPGGQFAIDIDSAVVKNIDRS